LTVSSRTAELIPTDGDAADLSDAQPEEEADRADDPGTTNFSHRHLWYSDLRPSRIGIQVHDWCVCCSRTREVGGAVMGAATRECARIGK
jgi:hypothetical protein